MASGSRNILRNPAIRERNTIMSDNNLANNVPEMWDDLDHVTNT